MVALKRLAIVIAATLLTGCSVRFPPLAKDMHSCPLPAEVQRAGLYFVTSRAPDCPPQGVGPVLTIARGDRLAYGTFTPDGAPTLATQSGWDAALDSEVSAAGRVIVYIHGYNNDFGIAARRAAATREAASQLDQGSHAPVILFSWPSQSATLKYPWDENNAAWTQPDIDDLLADLTRRADRVTLVAHSMGTRLAVAALLHLQERDPGAAARIDRLILAAPDIDRDTLTRDARGALLASGRKVTFYVSRLDRAIQTSWTFHGYARAGDPSCHYDWRRRPDRKSSVARCYWPKNDSGPWPDIVDLSIVWRNPLSLGHADFIESQGGYADLCQTLAGKIGPNRTGHATGDGIWLLPETPTVQPLHC